jgi:hypothetical protein
MDLLKIISKIPGVEIPEQVPKALANKEIARDLNVILSEAAPLFDAAAKSPATDASLKSVFNDVAAVLPAVSTYLRDGKLSLSTGLQIGPTFLRLSKANKTMKDAFNKPDPAISVILDSLLGNTKVQEALTRILTKPEGKGLFLLEEGADGQGYAVEQLSGSNLKFPLTKENYATIKAIFTAANTNNKPQPPRFGT